MTEKNINGLLAVFFIVLTAGFAFHRSETFSGGLPGHIMGVAGTGMIFMTLVYPFKKRVLGKRGRQNPLGRHIFYGLMGPSLVVVHSGHKLDSLIGMLTFAAMLIVVLSGITGKFLSRKVGRSLKEQQSDLAMLKDGFQRRREEISACYFPFSTDHEGKNETRIQSEPLEAEQGKRCEQLLDLARSISELEYTTKVFHSTKSLFSKWMKVHHVLTLFLFSFIIVHVLTVVYYGLRWVP